MIYARPLVQSGAIRPADAVFLAGGPLWFREAEILSRTEEPRLVAAVELPVDLLKRLTTPRAPICGLDMGQPQIMGSLNVTPDSFSDGGQHNAPAQAVAHAQAMTRDGAALIDIGGESTRPGADFIPAEEEIARTAPIIAALAESASISIDTRKADVAQAALGAGAALVNDVSGLQFDAAMAETVARAQAPICVMHSQGTPDTMQHNPRYGDVLLEVYDFLHAQVAALDALGLSRDKIVVDPGIGFGKTQEHNLALLKGLSLFHGLGCAILLGVSRKRFIGDIGRAPDAAARAPGSIAVGLAGLAQGVQILRVHDVAETAQAVRLWQAVR
ncbi:MAG: dihydropteroate synthase [Rhodobacteraceae bacterium]|nr:dihydropteroate synthase [Paracoccaceae bacterium]